MVRQHLIQQVNLLKEHLALDNPDPRFIERHALAIIDLARELPMVPDELASLEFESLFQDRTA